MATPVAEQGFEPRAMGSNPEGFPSHHRLLTLQRPPSPSLSSLPAQDLVPNLTHWPNGKDSYLGAASDQCLAIVPSMAFKLVTSRGPGVRRCRVAAPKEQDS